MKELSLNILDIAENSVKAGALLTEITVEEDSERLRIIINDNGCGMDEETLKQFIADEPLKETAERFRRKKRRQIIRAKARN